MMEFIHRHLIKISNWMPDFEKTPGYDKLISKVSSKLEILTEIL